MIKVSILIPIYNASKYICNCLDSLRKQTLKDIEVILVDDCSKDNSIDIIKEYIAKHNISDRFIILEQSINSGPGIARNIGIKQAKGEYIEFVDGDDWIEPTACEELYQEAIRYDADLCYCQASMDFFDGNSRILSNPTTSKGLFSKVSRSIFLTTFTTYCWTYLYKRDFLLQNELFFPSGRSAEDSAFLAKCILACNNISYINRPLYHYVINPDSLTQSTNSDRYKQKLDNIGLILDYAKLYPAYADELQYIYIKKGFIVGMCDYIKDNINPEAMVIKESYSLLKKKNPSFSTNRYYKKDFKVRLCTILLSKFPLISIFLLSLFFRFFKK